MNWELAALWFITFVISVTVHEAAHAWTAMLGGDRTAYRAGQVTLNPIPHMRREPFGMLILPLLLLYTSGGQMCMGFAHAPVDPVWAHHHPKKAALMSAAGPVSNLLLAAVAFAVLWFIGRGSTDTLQAIRKIAGFFLFMNLLLAVLNFIPLPPLDGSGVLSGLSRTMRNFYDGLRRLPYVPLVILVVIIFKFEYLFGPVWHTVNGWLPVPWYYR